MTILLIFALVLAGVTTWYLARPLRAAPVPPQDERDALIQLRDRLVTQLREIDVEAGDRNMEATVANDERQRLEAELAQVLKGLDNTEKAGETVPPVQSRRPWLIAVVTLALVLPLVSAVLYFGQNITVLAALSEASRSSQVAAQGVPPMVLQMVSRLEQRLQAQPHDPKGWAQLGRSYVVLGRGEEAGRAFGRAYQLAPEDPEIMAAYASFLMQRDPAHPPADAVAIFRKLYAKNPQNPAALWALGVVAFYDQKFDQAIKHWEQLHKQLAPNSDTQVQVERAIEAARARSGK